MGHCVFDVEQWRKEQELKQQNKQRLDLIYNKRAENKKRLIAWKELHDRGFSGLDKLSLLGVIDYGPPELKVTAKVVLVEREKDVAALVRYVCDPKCPYEVWEKAWTKILNPSGGLRQEWEGYHYRSLILDGVLSEIICNGSPASKKRAWDVLQKTLKAEEFELNSRFIDIISDLIFKVAPEDKTMAWNFLLKHGISRRCLYRLMKKEYSHGRYGDLDGNLEGYAWAAWCVLYNNFSLNKRDLEYIFGNPYIARRIRNQAAAIHRRRYHNFWGAPNYRWYQED